MELQLEGAKLYYEEYGAGKPILILHGLGLDHYSIMMSMEPIFKEKKQWKRIYLDLPGMGKSIGEDWIQSSDDMLQVILHFIEQVIPNESFVLVGESYGGYLCRGILYQKPERVDGMLLICSPIEAERFKRELPPHQVLVYDEQLIHSLEDKEKELFTSLAVVQDQKHWERFKDILQSTPAPDSDFLQKIKKQYAFSFPVDQLSEPFQKPVLMLAGRQDSVAGYRDHWKIIENYPRGTFAVLDRAGHNLIMEQSHLFECLVKEWLDRVNEEQEKMAG
ncbi:alpha/beta fold hydrolase [Thermoflavimicrobium dichotomicum]|nr:alpha/beta hydrolase [Thermoflavimicrobium dichotomicum]